MLCCAVLCCAGWALCGHDAPPGQTDEGMEVEEGGGEGSAAHNQKGEQGKERQIKQHQEQQQQKQEQQQQEQQLQHPEPQQQAAEGHALRGGQAEVGTYCGEARAWDPVLALPREQRMGIGALCKQLIDRWGEQENGS